MNDVGRGSILVSIACLRHRKGSREPISQVTWTGEMCPFLPPLKNNIFVKHWWASPPRCDRLSVVRVFYIEQGLLLLSVSLSQTHSSPSSATVIIICISTPNGSSVHSFKLFSLTWLTANQYLISSVFCWHIWAVKFEPNQFSSLIDFIMNPIRLKNYNSCMI